MNGPQPIPMADIWAYFQAEGFGDAGRFLRVQRSLDGLFMAWALEKIAAERERAK